MSDEPVDIELIMQEIRQKILAEKGANSDAPAIPINGDRFPREFYEHLYHAGLAYDQIGVKMLVTPVNIPIVGKLIERFRTALHTLVLYYVNQVTAQQTKVNYHLLQAISIVSQELEEADADI